MEEMKVKAEELFNKIKKAHEVLADPVQRAIYDTTGIKGLETDGWQVIPRTRTPQEILEEFDRLQKEKEEQRLQQRTNPKGTVTVGIDSTDLFDRYSLNDIDQHLLPNLEISEMSISQSVECPLTTKDTAVLSGHLSSHNGNGTGTFSVAVRRILSHTGWAEVELAAGNGTSSTIRAFRTLWRRGYGTMSGTLHLTPSGVIRPGCNIMVAHQLDKNLQGRLSWSGGMNTALNAMMIWDYNRHHLVLGCQLGIPSSFALVHYSHKFIEHDAKIKATVRVGTFGAMFEYGCEKKVTQFSYLAASVTVGIPLGVSLRIRLNRGSQTFTFPIRLSESILPSAVFYGTFLPIVTYFLVKKLVVDPYISQQKAKELQEKKEANRQRMADKKKEALAAVELMKETVDRSFEIEEIKSGLVIRKALFGKLSSKDEISLDCIDVTQPLQALVKDSKLLLPAGTVLTELPGFYDPCVAELKELSIKYEFRRQSHECLFKHDEKILIPNPDHQMTKSTTSSSASTS